MLDVLLLLLTQAHGVVRIVLKLKLADKGRCCP
jgi:hypothetical protein